MTGTLLSRPRGYRRRVAASCILSYARPARLWLAGGRYRHHLRALGMEVVPNHRKRRLQQMALLAGQMSGFEIRDPQAQAWWLVTRLLEAIAATENGCTVCDAEYMGAGLEDFTDDGWPEYGCAAALLGPDWHGHWVAIAQPSRWHGEGRAERAALLREMRAAFAGVPGIGILEQIAVTEAHRGIPVSAMDADGIRHEVTADGTPYLKALSNWAPGQVRDAVAGGVLLWSVPWRACGQPYFELFDTSCGPVLMTDIGVGWAYSWDWPDAAAAVRHVRQHTARADLEHDGDYLRRHASILLSGPWGLVVEQRGHVRAIFHGEHGPETWWYHSRRQAFDAAIIHVRNRCAWARRLRGGDPESRDDERGDAVDALIAGIAALTPPDVGWLTRAARVLRAAGCWWRR